MGINVNYYDKIVYITSPTTDVTVQEILDAMRAAEDSSVGLAFGGPVKSVTDGFVDGEGEADVGGGYTNPLTITLDANWYIEFWDGVLLGTVGGGNISGGKDGRPVRAEVGSADTVLVVGAERGIQVGSGVTQTDIDDIADAVWDEILTGATHNIASSAGRRLRNVSGTAITDGTCPSTGTVNTVYLNGDAFTTDGAYDPALIAIVAGTGAGQCRNILQYDGSARQAVVDRNWKTIPDNTSQYVIYSDSGREHVNEGLAQGGTSTSITLNTLASSDNDAYIGQRIFIRSGTGQDQARRITAYNGTTKVATVATPFSVIPDTTSGYVMLPTGAMSDDCIASAVWDADLSTYTDSGSTGSVFGKMWKKVKSIFNEVG
jgi:hypothetical protein